jgi:hypothetical protein
MLGAPLVFWGRAFDSCFMIFVFPLWHPEVQRGAHREQSWSRHKDTRLRRHSNLTLSCWSCPDLRPANFCITAAASFWNPRRPRTGELCGSHARTRDPRLSRRPGSICWRPCHSHWRFPSRRRNLRHYRHVRRHLSRSPASWLRRRPRRLRICPYRTPSSLRPAHGGPWRLVAPTPCPRPSASSK